MRLAPEGWPFIWVAAGADLALLAVWYGWPSPVMAALPVLGLLLTIWLLVFFRDPARRGPRGDDLVISPADGKVVGIARLDETTYLHREATRISVFMNVLDVHVNRYPVSGEIEIVHYNPGQFSLATREKASLLNEQSSVGIAGPRGKILVRQIAGLIARRIVTDGAPGERAEQGERMGMIRFGSRVDVFVDPTASVKVQEGERVKAGVTVLAEFPR
jgi:phosphatidylserine decarboxylase